jgi:aminoglycoside 2''-phosphotransferase
MSAEAYRAVITACFPELAITSCVIHSQGWDSVAVLVDDTFIFRFPKRPDVEPQYRAEARLLPQLAATLSVAVPHFEFIWPGGPAYPQSFVGYRMIAGQPLDAALLRTLQAEPLAKQLGRAIGELHRFPTKQAAQAGVRGGDVQQWRDEYRALYERIQAQVFPLLSTAARERCAARFEAFLQNKAYFQFAPTLIHRDLNAEHILVDPARNAVSGIIDWGDAAIGDKAIDFTGLYAELDREFMDQVLAHYDAAGDSTLRERALFYAFVIPFHAILFGQLTASQRHIDDGLAQLQAALGP